MTELTRAGRRALEVAEQAAAVRPMGQRYKAKTAFAVGLPRDPAEVAKATRAYETEVARLMRGLEPCAACGREYPPAMTRAQAEQQMQSDVKGSELWKNTQPRRVVNFQRNDPIPLEVLRSPQFDVAKHVRTGKIIEVFDEQ
jgi:hypothetical protein